MTSVGLEDGSYNEAALLIKNHSKLVDEFKKNWLKTNSEIARFNKGIKKYERIIDGLKNRVRKNERNLKLNEYMNYSIDSATNYSSVLLNEIRDKLKSFEERIKTRKITNKNQEKEYLVVESTISEQIKSVESNIEVIQNAFEDIKATCSATVASCKASENVALDSLSRWLDIWPSLHIWMANEAGQVVNINNISTLAGLIAEWSTLRAIGIQIQEFDENFKPSINRNVTVNGSNQVPLHKLKLAMKNRYDKLLKLSSTITERIQELETQRKWQKTMLLELAFSLEEDCILGREQCEFEAIAPYGHALEQQQHVSQNEKEKNVNHHLNEKEIAQDSNLSLVMEDEKGAMASSSYFATFYSYPLDDPNKFKIFDWLKKLEISNNFLSHLFSNRDEEDWTWNELASFFQSPFLDSKASLAAGGVFSSSSVESSRSLGAKSSLPSALKLNNNFSASVAASISSNYSNLNGNTKTNGLTTVENAINKFIHHKKQSVLLSWNEMKNFINHCRLIALETAEVNVEKVSVALEKATVDQYVPSNQEEGSQSTSQVPDDLEIDKLKHESDRKVMEEMMKFYDIKEREIQQTVKERKILLRDWFDYLSLSNQMSSCFQQLPPGSEGSSRYRAQQLMGLLVKRFQTIKGISSSSTHTKLPSPSPSPSPSRSLGLLGSSSLEFGKSKDGENQEFERSLGSRNEEEDEDNYNLPDGDDMEGFEFNILGDHVDSNHESHLPVSGKLLHQSAVRVSGEVINLSFYWQSEFERIKLIARSFVENHIEEYVLLLHKADIADLFGDEMPKDSDIHNNAALVRTLLKSIALEKISRSMAYNLTMKSRIHGAKAAFKSLPPLLEISDVDCDIRVLTIRNSGGALLMCTFGKAVRGSRFSDSKKSKKLLSKAR